MPGALNLASILARSSALSVCSEPRLQVQNMTSVERDQMGLAEVVTNYALGATGCRFDAADDTHGAPTHECELLAGIVIRIEKITVARLCMRR